MPERTFNLSQLDGRNGFAVTGNAQGNKLGRSVSSAGDVNGDGVDDFIIGTGYGDPGGRDNAGEAYVILGHRGTWPARFPLSSLNGSNGFTLEGINPSNYAGNSVSSAGDLNGDGVADMVIGSLASPNGRARAGESYVVFGHGGPWSARMVLSSLNGSNGLALQGAIAESRSGYATSSVGDINGDGVSDVMIGAPYAAPNGNTQAGLVYVVFGHRSVWPAQMVLSALNGSNGFVYEGTQGDRNGVSVASAGDVNGDGLSDVIIGASIGNDIGNNERTGEAYILFGHRGNWPVRFGKSALNGSNGVLLPGRAYNERCGESVTSAGDLNGDGLDDVAIGAPKANPNNLFDAGVTYIVFGRRSAWPARLPLSSLNGSNGFILEGAGWDDDSGRWVSSVPDVNGDGLSDLMVASIRADPNGRENAGETYVVFGSRGVWPARMNLSEINGSNGVVLQGVSAGDISGYAMASAGDVNGDGVSDVVVAAINAAPNGLAQAGEVYVVFGGSESFSANQIAIDSGQRIRLNQSNLAVDPVIGSRVFHVSNVSHGQFVSNDNISQILTSFTQQQINNGAVLFIHDGSRQAPNYTVSAQGITRVFSDVHPQSPNVSFTVVVPRISAPHSVFNLSQLDGRNGFALEGGAANDQSGVSVSSAGDVNGDGFSDLMVGAFRADPGGRVRAGETNIIFGHNGSWLAHMNLSTLNGSNGFVLEGISAGDESGVSVASGCDLNNDGLPDLMLGAHSRGTHGSDTGESYVIFGHRGAWPPRMVLSALNGSNGFRASGLAAGDQSGISVACAGDVNDDGVSDIILAAPHADPGGRITAGESYLVFGHGGIWPDQMDLSRLNGTNGLVFEGVTAGDRSGRSVASAGDMNADGVDDVILGALHASPNGRVSAGESYVIFGHQGAWSAQMVLSTLNGSNGFVLEGIDADDISGVSVSSAGDMNGDGVDDVMIGAYQATPNGNASAGETYVIFGHRGAWPTHVPLSSLNGSNGFVLEGIAANDFSSQSISSAGDVNGDGFSDLMIGAIAADPNGRNLAGETYVLFGHDGAWPARMSLSLLDGSNGLVLQGAAANDRSGASVAAAGDVNGDGVDDVMIGASLASPDGQAFAGESYVIFGGAEPFSANQLDISRGETVILSTNNMAVDPLIDSRYFNVTGVEHGHFALASDRLSAIDSFIQSQISGGEIVFVHDGSVHAPNYTVSAQGITRVFSNVHPQVANIRFALPSSPTAMPTSFAPSATPMQAPVAVPTQAPTLSPSALFILNATTTLLSTVSGLNGLSTSTPLINETNVDEGDGGDDNTLIYVVVAAVALLMFGAGIFLGCRRKRQEPSTVEIHSVNVTPMTMNPAYRGPGNGDVSPDPQGSPSSYGVFRNPGSGNMAQADAGKQVPHHYAEINDAPGHYEEVKQGIHGADKMSTAHYAVATMPHTYEEPVPGSVRKPDSAQYDLAAAKTRVGNDSNTDLGPQYALASRTTVPAAAPGPLYDEASLEKADHEADYLQTGDDVHELDGASLTL